MDTVTITRLYSLLTEKLDEETAETLTSYIAEKVRDDVRSAMVEIATKDFVKKEIAGFENRLSQSLAAKMYWISLIQILTVVGGIIAIYQLQQK